MCGIDIGGGADRSFFDQGGDFLFDIGSDTAWLRCGHIERGVMRTCLPPCDGIEGIGVEVDGNNDA